jgi:hypothetical protein
MYLNKTNRPCLEDYNLAGFRNRSLDKGINNA